MFPYLLVFLGSGLGGTLRYGVNLLTAWWLGAPFPGAGFPWATLAVNVLGGLMMGMLTGWLSQNIATENASVKLFLGVGILGGFTTFSAFSLDAVLLFERGDMGLVALYVMASIILSIGGVASGLALIRIMV
jgi:fluoride exporter